MRTVIARLLYPFSINVTKSTSKDKVLSVIEKMHPYQTDKKLIRVGPNYDGGYLVPDDLEGIETCFSPGVGPSSAFEISCANLGMEIYLADKSVNGPAENHKNFHFTKKFIGPYTNDSYMTMDSWVDDVLMDKKSDLLLQMDIEGFEYFTFMNMSERLLIRCRIILVEFHNLEKLWNTEYVEVISTTLEKLNLTHTCVHVHPNNCSRAKERHNLTIPDVIELSFLRNDRIRSKTPATIFPHPLDADNHLTNESIVLPKGWYKE